MICSVLKKAIYSLTYFFTLRIIIVEEERAPSGGLTPESDIETT